MRRAGPGWEGAGGAEDRRPAVARAGERPPGRGGGCHGNAPLPALSPMALSPPVAARGGVPAPGRG